MRKLILFFSMSYCLLANAGTIHVPAQYAGIQAALNAAGAGDTVLVSAGTYKENIAWPATNDLHLLAETNSGDKPVVDGGSTGRVIDIEADGSTVFRAEISGFVIANGLLNIPAHKGATGAGIFASNAVLKLSKCLVRNNIVTSTYDIQNSGGGAGLSIVSTPAGYINEVDGCRFIANAVVHLTNGDGPAIHLDNAATSVKNTEIGNNKISVSEVALGMIYSYQGDITLDAVRIENNKAETTTSLPAGYAAIKGTAVFSFLANATLINCKIANNNSTPYISILSVLGAAVYFYGEGTALNIGSCTIANNKRTDNAPVSGTALFFSSLYAKTAALINSILWNPGNGDEIKNFYKPVAVDYSDIRNGYPGTGNKNADPNFVSTTDLHLQLNSVCINAGNNRFAPSKDIDRDKRPLPAGTNTDMGCYEMDQSVSATGIAADLQQGKALKPATVFPNPSNGYFVLTVTTEWKGATMKLFNASGQLVHTQKIFNSATAFNLSLRSSVYILELVNEKGVTEKLKIAVVK